MKCTSFIPAVHDLASTLHELSHAATKPEMRSIKQLIAAPGDDLTVLRNKVASLTVSECINVLAQAIKANNNAAVEMLIAQATHMTKPNEQSKLYKQMSQTPQRGSLLHLALDHDQPSAQLMATLMTHVTSSSLLRTARDKKTPLHYAQERSTRHTAAFAEACHQAIITLLDEKPREHEHQIQQYFSWLAQTWQEATQAANGDIAPNMLQSTIHHIRSTQRKDLAVALLSKSKALREEAVNTAQQSHNSNLSLYIALAAARAGDTKHLAQLSDVTLDSHLTLANKNVTSPIKEAVAYTQKNVVAYLLQERSVSPLSPSEREPLASRTPINATHNPSILMTARDMIVNFQKQPPQKRPPKQTKREIVNLIIDAASPKQRLLVDDGKETLTFSWLRQKEPNLTEETSRAINTYMSAQCLKTVLLDRFQTTNGSTDAASIIPHLLHTDTSAKQTTPIRQKVLAQAIYPTAQSKNTLYPLQIAVEMGSKNLGIPGILPLFDKSPDQAKQRSLMWSLVHRKKEYVEKLVDEVHTPLEPEEGFQIELSQTGVTIKAQSATELFENIQNARGTSEADDDIKHILQAGEMSSRIN